MGKGLGALIPEAEEERPKSLLFCGIEEIVPNRSQPRKHFDDARLDDLAQSIRRRRILEPLIVRKTGQGYEIVIGERRWRAAQRAGLKEVPVIVRQVEDARSWRSCSSRTSSGRTSIPSKRPKDTGDSSRSSS